MNPTSRPTVLVTVYPKSLINHHHLVRYCLGYKQLPFTAVWVELPDITRLIESKGITNLPYTLPAIEDPNTGTFVVDSLAIATYLNETYPETPKVLGSAASRMLEGVGDVFSFGSGGGTLHSDIAPRLVFLVLAGTRLNPVSKEYYYQTRAARLGDLWAVITDACSASAGPEGRAERVRQGIEAIRARGIWGRVTRYMAVVMSRRAGHRLDRSRSGKNPAFLISRLLGG